MRAPSHLLHGEITDRIIAVYHEAHYQFGHGFLERLCQRVMVIALTASGLRVTEEPRFEVHFRGQCIGEFFPDIIVDDVVLVEVKSCAALEPRHRAQVINYLRASTIEVGLLLNFGPKREFERMVFTNDRKQRRSS